MQVYGTIGVALLALGALPFARFGYFVIQGESSGHIQSLVAGAALWIVGGQMFITGMLATAIAWNRRMLEDVLFRMKDERSVTDAPRISVRRTVRAATVEGEMAEYEERQRDAA
jgi:hypothetical protein